MANPHLRTKRIDLPPAVIAWIEASAGPGAELVAAEPQGGATSSTLHRLELHRSGRRLRWILRRFTNQEWLAEEPDAAVHEAASLEQARAAGLPTPELIACDPEGAQTGLPALLMTRLPGYVDLLPPDFDAWLRQQAEILLPLHAVQAPGFRWRYAPYVDLARLKPPGWSSSPGLWERAIEIANGPPPPAKECFIHRDFHPVNVLWQHGWLSGLVDWANACRGPAGIDVAWCRSNLAGLYGVQAADRFLHFYISLAGSASAYHPYWDLLAALEVLPGPPDVYPPWVEYGVQGLTNTRMLERIEAYLASILEKLAPPLRF